jgi:hypothetical protein
MINKINRTQLPKLVRWLLSLNPPDDLKESYAELLDGLNVRCYAQPLKVTPIEGDTIGLEPGCYRDESGQLESVVRMYLNTESIALAQSQSFQVGLDLLRLGVQAAVQAVLAEKLLEAVPGAAKDIEEALKVLGEWVYLNALNVEEIQVDYAGEERTIAQIYETALKLIRQAATAEAQANLKRYLHSGLPPQQAVKNYTALSAHLDSAAGAPLGDAEQGVLMRLLHNPD